MMSVVSDRRGNVLCKRTVGITSWIPLEWLFDSACSVHSKMTKLVFKRSVMPCFKAMKPRQEVATFLVF
jgi:hypothetical protein